MGLSQNSHAGRSPLITWDVWSAQAIAKRSTRAEVKTLVMQGVRDLHVIPYISLFTELQRNLVGGNALGVQGSSGGTVCCLATLGQVLGGPR